MTDRNEQRRPKDRYFKYIKGPGDKNEVLITENAKLKELATTDALTGILNRRGFDEYMDQATNKKNRDFAIFMIDIDHFKAFNDSYGHEEGDRVLQKVSVGLKTLNRTGDLFARYGGEEFAVMIPRPPEDVELLKIANRYIDYFKEYGEGVTISLGLTKYYETFDLGDWRKTMHRADQALYQAKAKGRNTSEFIDYLEAKNLANNIIEFKNV